MNKYKILIADDDKVMLKMLQTFFTGKGYEVFVAHDGYQALQFAREHQPDVMLLDVNMPAGDGFSVQERMKKLAGVHSPVIYFTGEKSERVTKNVRELGGQALIHKPFEMAELLETVECVIAETKQKAA